MSTFNASVGSSRVFRRRAGRAFTIIEVIVIITIIGIIAAVIAPRLISRIGASKTATAKSNAASLATAMQTFLADCGNPESGATITILLERPSNVAEDAWKGPYVQSAEAILDPWGNPFVLLIPPKKNFDFDIVSYGKDGQQGGEGEDADVVAP
ncbi:MAG: type II secretion system major pseudopilin GspG [Planctomycetota bacterium]